MFGAKSYDRPVSSASGSGSIEDSAAEDERPDTAESVAIDPELAIAGHQQQQAQLVAQQPKEPRRQQSSQYKLQAKITGLERTGRKDPILRFDVHVSIRTYPTSSNGANLADQSSKIQNDSIP